MQLGPLYCGVQGKLYARSGEYEYKIEIKSIVHRYANQWLSLSSYNEVHSEHGHADYVLVIMAPCNTDEYHQG